MARRLFNWSLFIFIAALPLLAQDSGQSLADAARAVNKGKKTESPGKVFTGDDAQTISLGCYRDKPTRDLFSDTIEISNMTQDSCQSYCRDKGFRYAGAQYGKQCFCGDSFGRYGKLADTDCNTACAGDRQAKCGGVWANSVFQVSNSSADETAAPASYMGCYKDDSSRDMPGPLVETSLMTNAACQSKCRANGSRYAGTEGGNQCFCGDSYGRYGRLSESACNRPCAGNNRESCGGMWASSIYDLQGESHLRALGLGSAAGSSAKITEASDKDAGDSPRHPAAFAVMTWVEATRAWDVARMKSLMTPSAAALIEKIHAQDRQQIIDSYSDPQLKVVRVSPNGGKAEVTLRSANGSLLTVQTRQVEGSWKVGE